MASEQKRSDSKTEQLPPIMTVPETARYLRIGRNVAYELCRSGELPSIRLGRSIRVPRDALLTWQEERAAGAMWQGQPAANGKGWLGQEVRNRGR